MSGSSLNLGHLNVINSFRVLTRTAVLFAAPLALLSSVSSYADSSPKLGYRMMPQHPPQQNQFNSGSTFANSTYKDVTVPPHLTRPPIAQQHYPYYPHQNYPHQNHPNGAYPNDPYQPYPAQNGLTIIYNQSLPSQTTYRNESYGFVNGGANSSIESSSYMLISDWRRYNLPNPRIGMHWIYQNGRYLQISNDR